MTGPSAHEDTIIAPARVRVLNRLGWAMRRLSLDGGVTGYQVKIDDGIMLCATAWQTEFLDELTIPDFGALPSPLPSNVVPFRPRPALRLIHGGRP